MTVKRNFVCHDATTVCHDGGLRSRSNAMFTFAPLPCASFLKLQHESRQRWLSHVHWRGDHVLRRLTEFLQIFVGHLPEPRSQFRSSAEWIPSLGISNSQGAC